MGHRKMKVNMSVPFGPWIVTDFSWKIATQNCSKHGRGLLVDFLLRYSFGLSRDERYFILRNIQTKKNPQ